MTFDCVQRNWTKERGLVEGKDCFEIYLTNQLRCLPSALIDDGSNGSETD